MKATVATLLALLKASSAPRLTGWGEVWRLDGTDQRAEDLRRSFLALAAGFASVYVHYDGGQPDEPSLQDSKQVEPDVWRLPSAATGEDFSAWLYMGNWQLYAHAAPLKRIPDLCRADEAGVIRFVREAGVSFIVDSFHDDTHWTIGLRAEKR